MKWPKMIRTSRRAMVRAYRPHKEYYLALLDLVVGLVEDHRLESARDDIIAGEPEIAFDTVFANLYEDNARVSPELVERFIEVARALDMPFDEFEFLPEIQAFPEDADDVATRPLPPVPQSIRAAAEIRLAQQRADQILPTGSATLTAAAEDLWEQLRAVRGREELLRLLNTRPDITEPLLEIMQWAVSEGAWLDFDSCLLAAWQRPSPEFVPLLTSVLDRLDPTIHNEDLMDVLGEIGDPRAIDSLERALLWEPDWDEGFQIAQKAIWALGAIGTPEARQVITDAAEVGPEPVREQAASELLALDRRNR